MLVLASQSPRRQEILTRAGIPFLARPAEVDESRLGDESPEDHVRRLAREKVDATSARPGDVVVVLVDGEILGKPADRAEAERMLWRLSGREHVVLTGVCLKAPAGTRMAVESTVVSFVALSEEEVHDYVASGEPMDKAGAYAIQGLASKFIDRIEGCYFNVVGLPVALVYRMLKELAAVRE